MQGEEAPRHTEGIDGCEGTNRRGSIQTGSQVQLRLILQMAHEIRADSMAIPVGVDTVIRDDPSLTVRGPEIEPREQPKRVVSTPMTESPRIASSWSIRRDRRF
ncbi:MAG: hypothetical protein Ct9H90mP1_1820 [Methanobacteriota archaeon]|nr:MAG: hypothetical protein Ct9H90mP1_1820 [Euryarchaeota archaeon]